MPYFTFRQNNSGGSFIKPAHNVVIEADSADDANHRAEAIGLYFDGCDDGMDCECCGDRWYAQCGNDSGSPEPMVYGRPAHEKHTSRSSWSNAWQSTLVVHKDGREDRYHFDGAEF